MIIYLLILLFSAAATLGIVLGSPSVGPWWSPLLFLASLISFTVLYLIFLFIASWFLSKKKPVEKTNRFCAAAIYETMQWLMILFRVRVEVRNRELVPDGPMVLVSNHISGFDPIAVIIKMRKRKQIFIAKESVLKVLMAGKYMYRAGYLAIDRENPLKAMKTIRRASEMVRSEGLDVGIYPEGTRSHTGEIADFKEGAFLLAKKTGVPIVVMRTEGSDRIRKNLPFRRTKVTLEFLARIEPEEIAAKSLSELAAVCHDIIKARQDELKAG